MSYEKYDIAVIGSGPGGFAAAVRASQLGAKTALIEKSEIGGTCLNCGCMPTKFLWQALNNKQKIQKSYEYGFKAALEPFSFADIIARKDKTIANIRKGMELILSSYPIDVIRGGASFKNANVLNVDSGGKEIFADKIIISAGTKPSSVKGFDFDGEKIINSADVLNLKEIPENILIVGGGAVGVEMAAVLAGFGSRVTLAERESFLLPCEDREISAEIGKSLQRQGVEVLTSCFNALENSGDYEKILIVAGRSAVGGLNPENAGIETGKNGFIITDKFCSTNVKNIYAAGDITGKNMLAYTAQNEGAASAENAVRGNSLAADNYIAPKVVFSNPPAASVKAADFESCKNISFGKFPFTASGRAFIENERQGFVKCAVDKDTQKPLAFWIFGAHADELINTASQILKNGGAVSREMFFHPSLSESLFNAYEDAFGRCGEKPKRK